MRSLNYIVWTILGAVAATTASACGPSPPGRTPDSGSSATMQSLGLPHAANATPVSRRIGPVGCGGVDGR